MIGEMDVISMQEKRENGCIITTRGSSPPMISPASEY